VLAALAPLIFATAAPVDTPSPVAVSAAVDEATSIDGWATVSQGYRLRTDGHAFDQDAGFFFDGGATTGAGRIGLDVSGALFYDVDGSTPAPHSAAAFPAAYDAVGPVTLLVDTLELRAVRAPWLPRLSVGRLTVDDGNPTTLDGAAVHVTPLLAIDTAWSLSASAGRTVHFFTYDETAREEWTAAIGGDAVYARQAKLALDLRAFAAESDSNGYRTSWGAAYDQRIADDLVLARAWMRGVDHELALFGARVHAAWPVLGADSQPSLSIGVDAQGIDQTATLGEVSEGDNPFFAVLGPSEPNARGFVDAWTRINPGFVDAGLHVGAAGRAVLRGAPGPFNRNFARVYASIDAADIALAGPFVSIITSYDAAVPRSDDARYAGVDPAVLAVGGSAGYAGDVIRASVGTSWDRTRYTYYRDVDELVDVRTVFASIELRPFGFFRVNAAYSAELADRVVHTVTVNVIEIVDGAP
jgi:hypothetical protein